MEYADLLKSKSLKIEISAEDLNALAAMLIEYGERKARQDDALQPLLTAEEVCAIFQRDRSTLSRWHKNKILRHNELGMYKRQDVINLINK